MRRGGRWAAAVGAWRSRLLPLALLAALGGAWQLAASSGALAAALNVESSLVPSPAEIANSFWYNRSLLAENTWVTLREILLGLGCAVLAGLLFAVLMRLSALLRHAAYPLLIASQAIPIVALAPIFVIWFGFGIPPKLLIVALVCFFPVTVSSLDGLRAVEPEAVKLMRALDASRWQTFRRVEVPTALPGFFSGLRIAAAVAPIGAVFAEWSGASVNLGGLGELIRVDLAQYETPRMFATVAILAALGLALFALVALVERLVVTWR